MALSEETTKEGIVGNFQDMLAMLASEYQRVCLDNSNLGAECSRLRACLSSKDAKDGKDDSVTTFDTCTLREDCWDYDLPRPKKIRNLDECPAARLPILSMNKETPPQEEPLAGDVPPSQTSNLQVASTASLGRIQTSELSVRRTASKSPSCGEGSNDPEKGWRLSGRQSISMSSNGGKLNRGDMALLWRPFRRTATRMTLNDAVRGANMKIASTSRLVVNPERSRFLMHWDQVTIVALAFVAVVTPVQVAMMNAQLDALFFINVVVDVVFFFDMILQFFLMFPVKTNYGMAYEHRHSVIVKNYLKGWLIIDLASILPFDLISVLSDYENLEKVKAVKVIRLLRLLKLARMRKVSRLFRRLEMRMAIAYQRLALAKFLTMLFLVTHWMANLWALTLVLIEEGSGVPRWVDAFDELEENVVGKTKDSLWKLYLTCLYFTSYTITSVGYGDIGPKNIIERIVCTLMIFVSGITWALLIAQVCSIVSSMDAEEQNFRKVMDELNYMMECCELPSHMRRRLRSFFLSNKSSARHARYLKIVDSMSPALRGEVCLEMNRMWIQKVSFLKGFLTEEGKETRDSAMQTFMVDVSRSLDAQVYAQGEAFGHPQVLYILNRGLASHTGRVRRSGAVWGTDFVLSNTRFLEPCGSFALTYVEVTCLEREKFFELVKKHNKACPHIISIVRRYSGWLAFQRWILLEAARRRQQLQLEQAQELENPSGFCEM